MICLNKIIELNKLDLGNSINNRRRYIMKKLEDAKMIGLRAKETNKIIAIYPEKVQGSNAEIETIVRDWYYAQSCSAEDELLSTFVDELTEEEIIECMKKVGKLGEFEQFMYKEYRFIRNMDDLIFIEKTV